MKIIITHEEMSNHTAENKHQHRRKLVTTQVISDDASKEFNQNILPLLKLCEASGLVLHKKCLMFLTPGIKRIFMYL